jgi:CheY-like chemotaxis protein
VDTLFESVSARGPEAIAVLLRGLGKDGAESLLAPRRGSRLTVRQEATSIVFRRAARGDPARRRSTCTAHRSSRAAAHPRSRAGWSDRVSTGELKPRVLVVDESETFRELISVELGRGGYDVQRSTSGQQALGRLAVERMECILLDRRMPGLSGEEPCRRIKASPAWRDIPLIMITATDEREAMIGWQVLSRLKDTPGLDASQVGPAQWRSRLLLLARADARRPERLVRAVRIAVDERELSNDSRQRPALAHLRVSIHRTPRENRRVALIGLRLRTPVAQTDGLALVRNLLRPGGFIDVVAERTLALVADGVSGDAQRLAARLVDLLGEPRAAASGVARSALLPRGWRRPDARRGADREDAAAAEPRKRRRARSAGNAFMRPILAVEDHYLNRRLVHDLTERHQHRVVEVTSVDEGRAFLKPGVPDIVLLDIGIAGGGDALRMREIRADPRLTRIPVLAVTAYAMVGDKERFIAAGFDGYPSKPINTRTFAAEVAAFLGSKT